MRILIVGDNHDNWKYWASYIEKRAKQYLLSVFVDISTQPTEDGNMSDEESNQNLISKKVGDEEDRNVDWV